MKKKVCFFDNSGTKKDYFRFFRAAEAGKMKKFAYVCNTKKRFSL